MTESCMGAYVGHRMKAGQVQGGAKRGCLERRPETWRNQAGSPGPEPADAGMPQA